MKSGEILAPAGSYESLVAAVRCGADAVYLGVGDFNARKNAENFSFDNLKEAVGYCHSHGVKVYLTLNTLVSDGEFFSAVDTAVTAAKCGIDAIIIQDLGLIRVLRKIMPSVSLHASTQMSVQTEYGITLLHSLGFKRAVLPRELSKDEILHLLKMSKTELEMFVHGALCMCVSGQCYMSAVIGSRSGNRGLCAQPCRLPVSAPGGSGYDLSLKDNSLIKYIKQMSDEGIASFKIEGRMKRPEYVAAAVTSCRNALDKKEDVSLENDLKNIFSRSGFTDGYFTGKIGKDMFGIRSKNDVISSASAIKNLAKLYEKESPKYPVDFFVKAKENKKIEVTAECLSHKIKIVSDVTVSPAVNKSVGENELKKQFEKCGGTQFFLGKFECDTDDNIFIGKSVINSLRREALEKITVVLSKKEEIEIESYERKNLPVHRKSISKNILVFSNINQMPKITDGYTVFLPITTAENDFKKLLVSGHDVGVVLPRGLSSNYNTVSEKLKKIKNVGIKKVMCPTLDGLAMAKETGLEITMGIGSNIYNSQSLEFLKDNGVKSAVVSFELNAGAVNSLGGDIPRGVAAYGKIPLMLTKNCPLKNGRDCSHCDKKGKLTDRKGIQFEVVCSMGYSEILNPFPLCIFDKKKDFDNIDFFMLLFTTESAEECKKIIRNFENSELPENINYTRGLYYRTEK